MPSHKTATVLLSLLLATIVYAAEDSSPIDFCTDISIVAKEIMTARQMDVPMSKVLPVAIERFRDLVGRYGSEVDMKVPEEAAMELVAMAYKRSSYPIESLQRTEIYDFENLLFEECYKNLTSVSEE